MADEPRNREIVEAGYDDVADRYAELEAPGHEWPRMRWLAKLLAQIEPGRAVLGWLWQRRSGRARCRSAST